MEVKGLNTVNVIVTVDGTIASVYPFGTGKWEVKSAEKLFCHLVTCEEKEAGNEVTESDLDIYLEEGNYESEGGTVIINLVWSDAISVTLDIPDMFDIGDTVEVCEPTANDLWNHSFSGTIIAKREDIYVVADGDEDCWDVTADQITLCE